MPLYKPSCVVRGLCRSSIPGSYEGKTLAEIKGDSYSQLIHHPNGEYTLRWADHWQEILSGESSFIDFKILEG